MPITPEQIVNAVRQAGIIGAGGAGFPTQVKLNARVDTVIANGSECEPLLYTDKTLIKYAAELVIEGLKLAMLATGARQGFIAVKGHYEDVVAVLRRTIPKDAAIRLHLLENYYPAGDEFLTVYDVTGRVIPEGGLPLHVGVVVNNVTTLSQIAQAVQGKPVTERMLTITGEVARPQVVSVPIGATYADLIQIAGGTLVDKPVVIDGGPMMGKIVENLQAGIGKTTSGILVLPAEHFVVRMKSKSFAQMAKQSKAACCQCIRCTDLCPRNLLGHEIYPHMTMRTIDYNQTEPKQHITSAFLCSQCGMCELIGCDIMTLSPRKVYAEYRKQLVARGIQNPHKRSGFKISQEYESRKVAIPTVLKKLGLTQYARPLEFQDIKPVQRVRISLKDHIGVPAVPKVREGQKVTQGELLASSPEGKLGTSYHASIAGAVTSVTDNYIEISS